MTVTKLRGWLSISGSTTVRLALNQYFLKIQKLLHWSVSPLHVFHKLPGEFLKIPNQTFNHVAFFFASHVTTLKAINLSLVKHDSTSCSISQVGKFNIPALHVHNIWTPFNLFLSQALRFSSPSDTSACEEPLQIFLLYNWITSQHVILLYTLQITIYIYCLQIWMSLYTL